VTLPLLSSNSLEIAHICGIDWRSYYCKVVNLCNFTSCLIILHKKLNVLNILKLNIAKINRIAF
jgi:hypothetical protein